MMCNIHKNMTEILNFLEDIAKGYPSWYNTITS